MEQNMIQDYNYFDIMSKAQKGYAWKHTEPPWENSDYKFSVFFCAEVNCAGLLTKIV